MSKIRIQFILSSSGIGGAERQLLLFLEHHDRSRFACEVVLVLGLQSMQNTSMLDIKKRLKELDIPFLCLDCDRFPSLKGLTRLYHAAKKSDASVIQVYGLAVDLVMRFFPLGQKIRIGSVRGTESQRSWIAFMLDGLTGRLVLDGYISNSEAGKRELISRGGVPAESIEVISNGIDAEGFSSEVESGRINTRRKSNRKKARVISVGNVSDAKGYQYLLEGMRLLHKESRVDVELLLVGSDVKGQMVREIARLNDEGCAAFFLGPRRDVAELLDTADIYISASVREGMSNSVMEAMAMGLPIIATDVGDSSILLDGGRCGILIQPMSAAAIKEAVLRYLQNPDLAKAHGILAAERVRDAFSIEKMVTKHERYYQRVIGGVRTRS